MTRDKHQESVKNRQPDAEVSIFRQRHLEVTPRLDQISMALASAVARAERDTSIRLFSGACVDMSPLRPLMFRTLALLHRVQHTGAQRGIAASK